MIATALEIFRSDTGRYPDAEEGLTAIVKDPGIPGWSGPYVRDQNAGEILAKYGYVLSKGQAPTLRRIQHPAAASK